MRPLIYSSLLVFLCLCCSDPYAQKIPSDVKKLEDNEALRDSLNQLSDEERELVAKYMLRNTMANALGVVTANVTVKEALEKQRGFEAEQAKKRAKQEKEEKEAAELAERLKKESAKIEDKMKSALTVALLELKFVESNWRKGIRNGFHAQIGFENKTDRNIKGVKGSILFADIFGDVIVSIGISFDEGIPAYKMITWNASFDYNQFKDEHKKLRNTPFDKLKIAWRPKILLFEDGSSLKLPTQ
jgi:hypothetical protein